MPASTDSKPPTAEPSTFSWQDAGRIIFVVGAVLWLIATGWAALARPKYEGSLPPSYTFNQYMASKGVDLEKGLPLHFGTNPQDGTSIDFVDSTHNNLQLNLQVGAHGYVFSVPRDYVSLQVGTRNWIQMDSYKYGNISAGTLPTWLLLGSDTSPGLNRSYKLVPIRKYELTDAMLLRSHPAHNRIVKIPITATPPWQHMDKIGVGSFLQEAQQHDSSNRGVIKAVFITLTPRALEKYKSQILK
jgi:hypothetical protein